MNKALSSNKDYRWKLLDNCYIYIYQTDEYFILPQFPESLTDSMNSTFSPQNALSRTAPVFSYNNSGPRNMQINLKLHRDMMNDINVGNSRVQYNSGDDIIHSIDDDYIDILIKKLQAIALPNYDSDTKGVKPPEVAVCLGAGIFIKGVVNSDVRVTHELPILRNNKYAVVSINFSVYETTAYDADSVGRLGSFRGLTAKLKSKIDDIKKSK